MKAITWIKNHLPTQRRLIQVYAALLYNANLKGYISGEIFVGNTKAVCVPGLNCYSCPGAVGACPLGALQNALASSGNRAPYYVLGILLLFGLTLGRTICGFLCPMGLIQELLHKIPTPKLKKGRVTRVLSYLKYVILAVFVVLIPLWYVSQHYPVPAFCKYICPAGTFEGAIGLLANPANTDKFSMLNILFTRKFVIMVLLFGVCVFVYRAFCRFLCPLGAIYGLFAKLNLVGVKVEEAKCTHCGLCVGHCKMDVRRVGDHECIHCAGCVDVCPTAAISFQAGSITLRAHEKAEAPKKRKLCRSRLLAWCVALAVLAAALAYYNLSAGASPGEGPSVTDAAPGDTGADISQLPEEGAESSAAPELPVGHEVGMLGPDFSVPLYGGGTFHLSDTRGTVTVINFWATWCTPCVAELPHFEELYRTYGESIEVIAVHSDLVTDDVDAYLANYDYTIHFALDDNGVVAAYGGSAMLPQTIVLDREGVIVYNTVGSVTYELLESIVAPLISEEY
ncbi:MAG: redoxin domain-containing protein [Clostridiales bacterium]|nr:redoxin domain-containing protein [Clostridiales bacterium]